jgi:hypothetical protein
VREIAARLRRPWRPAARVGVSQAAGNLDGLGFSYSEQALTAAGLAPDAAITSGGVRYMWPNVPAGQPDGVTAAGQVIPVPPLPGASELRVIGSATNGPSSGTLTITCTDGTRPRPSLHRLDRRPPGVRQRDRQGALTTGG